MGQRIPTDPVENLTSNNNPCAQNTGPALISRWSGRIRSDSIDQLIVRVRERLEVTTVAVTHDMRSARRIGQRILMLHQGRIHFSGTPEEIFQTQDPVVYRFVNGISDPKEPHF